MAIFTETLESGDLTGFDATSAPGSTVLDAHVDAKKNGSYGLRVIGDGSNSYVYGSINVSNLTEIYAGCWVYIDSGMTLGAFSEVAILSLLDGAARLCKIMFQNDTGSAGTAPAEWRIVGQSLSTVGTATNFSLDVWHWIEMHWKAGSGADGGVQVWIDEDSIKSEFDNDLSAYAVDIVRSGADYNDAMSNGNFQYIDDITADTSYIGIPAGGRTTKNSRAFPLGVAHAMPFRF